MNPELQRRIKTAAFLIGVLGFIVISTKIGGLIYRSPRPRVMVPYHVPSVIKEEFPGQDMDDTCSGDDYFGDVPKLPPPAQDFESLVKKKYPVGSSMLEVEKVLMMEGFSTYDSLDNAQITFQFRCPNPAKAAAGNIWEIQFSVDESHKITKVSISGGLWMK